MYLKQSISNGKPYLSFVQGYRKDGKVKQRTVEKLGYLEDLKRLYPDPVAHFKQVARERTASEKLPTSLTLNLTETLPDNTSNRKNLGYAAFKAIYSQLDIRGFFQKQQRSLEIGYNLNSLFSLLVFNRLLFPASKKSAFENNGNFFETCRFSLNDMYRSLDHFSDCSEQLQKYLYQQSSLLTGKTSPIAYYDVTNYYFEIPDEDEDHFDDNGNLLKKGLRKRGPSKENRKDPIVQMGLLMDSGGIPMAFHLFSGGESEKNSLLPHLRQVKRDFSLERMVVVADRGLNTSDNTAFLSGKNHDDSTPGDGYIYGQSILSADRQFKEWVLDPCGYVTDKETSADGETIYFKHKSRIYAKKILLKDSLGTRRLPMEIYQKQMVYYSEKYAKKQKRDREKVLAKARDLIKNPGKYTRATSVGAAGYVKNIKFVKDTGEIPDGLELLLDLEKISEEEKYDGYYSIVTSEKHLSDQELRNIYKGLWEIEESFKIMKSEFRARPVYVWTEDHIRAHFLICFTALLILRLLEQKLGGKYTIKQILHSLSNYSCSYLCQNYYLFDYRDEVICAIEDLFDWDLSKKIMSQAEIKKILQYRK